MTPHNQGVLRRRSIRLRGYDYSQAGAFFVTICCHNRKCLFGDIIDGNVRLNEIGRIAYDQWHDLPHRFSCVELDAFIVMPNHIHGILSVGAPLAGAQSDATPLAGAQFDTAPLAGARSDDADQSGQTTTDLKPGNRATAKERATARVAPTVGDIVGAYKSLCVHVGLKTIRRDFPGQTLGTLWQRNYWEHIIRDEQELEHIREYIDFNPSRWKTDRLHPVQTNGSSAEFSF